MALEYKIGGCDLMFMRLRRIFYVDRGSLSVLCRSSVRVACLILVAALLAGTCSTVSFASPINLGDFMGNTVTYVNVQEDSNSGDPPGMFGPASVSGDSLDFNPVGFSAHTSGLAVDQTDGQLSFMVVAKPQSVINNFNITEFGDTTLAGIGNDHTFTAVTTSVFIDIVGINGVGVNAIKLQKQLTFTPSNGDFGLATDGGGGPLFHTLWTGTLGVDLNQELALANMLGKVTKINVNLDNTLMAISQVGTSALIAKKDFTGVIITVNSPEPASCVLALMALIGSVLLVRRRDP
jgi:hypothetical protein